MMFYWIFSSDKYVVDEEFSVGVVAMYEAVSLLSLKLRVQILTILGMLHSKKPRSLKTPTMVYIPILTSGF